MNPLRDLQAFGQQLWLDNLSRPLLRNGILQRLIDEDGISGVTSNPSIFYKALQDSPYYRHDLEQLRVMPLSVEARYEQLAIADIQAACDLLQPVWQSTQGDAGYVSMEVSPHLAHDEAGTIAAAKRLRNAVARTNLLIKVPATPSGLCAIKQLTAEGINVNVTLMFSVRHEIAVAHTYIAGARRWLDSGGDPRALKSVASIFLSRVDTLADKRLEAIGTPTALALRGKSAIAMARIAYARYYDIFHGPTFSDLSKAGVRPQYPLWASTGTKNLAYSDVLYVESLIGAETVNTLPESTLDAFRNHGTAVETLNKARFEDETHIQALNALGIDLDDLGEELQIDGVRLFAEAYDQLLQLVT